MIAVSLVVLLSLSSLSSAAYVTINWDRLIRISNTTTTCQVVVAPMLTRGSKIHEASFDALKNLGAKHIRFAPWFTYPRLSVAQLYPPSGTAKCGHLEGNWNNGTWDLDLECPDNYVMSDFDFASYGTPSDECGKFERGFCHARETKSIVEALCKGKQYCRIPMNNATFGDPCPKTNKRLSVQTKCVSPSDPKMEYYNANWNFTLMDPIVEDFMTRGGGNDPWISFMTFPSWKYEGVSGSGLYTGIPDSPFASAWGYEQGKVLRDETATSVGDYYNKVISYYTQGGFEDEYGNKHVSNLHYPFQYFEILNEPEAEHQNTVESYTITYDQIVRGIRAAYPAQEREKLQFMGMALQFHKEWDWYSYFLNSSNHQPGTPMDYISFHNYIPVGSVGSPTIYDQLFPESDQFIMEVGQILNIRDSLSPNTRTAINEIGILPSDAVECRKPGKSLKMCAGRWPPNPLDYLSGAAYYAYLFGKLAPMGVDILGVSQFMGTIDMTEEQSGLPGGTNANWGSGTLIDPFTGIPNARYWGLKLLIDHFEPGDALMDTYISNSTAVFGLGARSKGTLTQKVLLINKVNEMVTVNIRDEGFSIGKQYFVDDNSGLKSKQIKTASITMNPFTIAVIYPQK